MKTIQLKDKVISQRQLADVFEAINQLFVGERGFRPEQIKFHAQPHLGAAGTGFLSNVQFEVDDPVESSLLQILRNFGFIERKKDTLAQGPQLLESHSVRKAVKDYINQTIANSREKIDWAILYDLKNPDNVPLLFISDEVVPSESGELDVYRFAPSGELFNLIPGRVMVTLASPSELNFAVKLRPDQPLVGYLQEGDYEVFHAPSGVAKLREILPWVGDNNE